jgi:lipopolysaccharide export system ATP-binding protein
MRTIEHCLRENVMDDQNEPLLEVIGLAKTYGRRKVVDGVDLYVDRQEIVGLLGPNGAGKTTSFRMICGLIEPDHGRVFLNAVEVTNWPMFKRCRDGHMGYLAQESSIFRKLSVEQNLLAIMELIGMDRKTRRRRCDELLDDFEIKHLRKMKSAKLSGGERRRLEIARCLVSNPEIIMLDEPFAGIDPVTVQNIQGIIRRLRDDGLSILITDHAAREILQVTDRCYIINKGTVLCDGPPDEVKSHPEVKQIYLGDLDSAESGPPAPHMRTRNPRPNDLAPMPTRRSSREEEDE